MVVYEAGYEYAPRETCLHIQITKSNMTRLQTIKKETEKTESEQLLPYTDTIVEHLEQNNQM